MWIDQAFPPLECVDKLPPKNDKERKPTELTPYVASCR